MTIPKRAGFSRLAVSLILLVAVVVVMVTVPAARPFTVVVACVLLATALVGLGQLLHLGSVDRARVAGAALLLLGVGFAVAARVVWADPTVLPEGAFPVPGPTGLIVVGLAGAVIFGGIGAFVLIRGGRPPR